MAVAPKGDSCKRLHDWEYFLVKESVHQLGRLYGRQWQALFMLREKLEIGVQCCTTHLPQFSLTSKYFRQTYGGIKRPCNKYIYKYICYICVCVNILCWGVQGLRQWQEFAFQEFTVVSSIAQYASTYSSSEGGGVQISLASVSLLFIIQLS